MTPDLNWQDACSFFEQQRNETKEIVFSLGTDREIRFVIRLISQADKDRIESSTIKNRSRRHDSGITADDLRGIKHATIKAGVVSGPTGWTGSDQDIAALPATIRDELADSIQQFATLDEETRIGFR